MQLRIGDRLRCGFGMLHTIDAMYPDDRVRVVATYRHGSTRFDTKRIIDVVMAEEWAQEAARTLKMPLRIGDFVRDEHATLYVIKAWMPQALVLLKRQEHSAVGSYGRQEAVIPFTTALRWYVSPGGRNNEEATVTTTETSPDNPNLQQRE